jgi:hypothetical protein
VNYRRRLFTVWLLFSGGWIAYWAWHYGANCALQDMAGLRAITCHWSQSVDGAWTVVGQTVPMMPMVRDIAITTLAPPAAALLAGLLVYWAIVTIERRSQRP